MELTFQCSRTGWKRGRTRRIWTRLCILSTGPSARTTQAPSHTLRFPQFSTLKLGCKSSTGIHVCIWFRLAVLNTAGYLTSIFFMVTKVLNVVERYRYGFNLWTLVPYFSFSCKSEAGLSLDADPNPAFHLMRFQIRFRLPMCLCKC